jgi:integrase
VHQSVREAGREHRTVRYRASDVLYSRLAEVVADNTQNSKKKSYNNVTGAVRTAFKFSYKDFPGKSNPALALPSFRITTKGRPKVDPFTIQDAESIIAAAHRITANGTATTKNFDFLPV